MNVLVIAAHPDDEVLGCGGTISRLAKEGQEVYMAVLGEGVTSRYDNPNDADRSLVEALHENSREVAKHLGAKDLRLFDLPDNRFDTVALLDIVKIVEEMIDDLRPRVIYTHHGGYLNIDHVLTNRAVLTATRPVADCPVEEIYAFEVASSTEWAFQQLHPPFRPNVFVNIEDTLEAKLRGMEIYGSETRSFPHPRSEEGLRVQARRWGAAVGLEYAEAFELVRSIRR